MTGETMANKLQSGIFRPAVMIGTGSVGIGLMALLLLLWIFGKDSPDTVPRPVASVETQSVRAVPHPSPSLAELRLHGVMGTGGEGAAIIAIGAAPQRLIRVGREVVPGVPLIAVADRHILVRENGREIQIPLVDASEGALPSVRRAADGSIASDAMLRDAGSDRWQTCRLPFSGRPDTPDVSQCWRA